MTTDQTLLGRWPEHLIKQLVSGNFVLVMGAGISRGCINDVGLHPPGWEDLISGLARELLTGVHRKSVIGLVKAGRLLEAAELLRARARATAKEEDFLHRVADLTDGGATAAEQFKPSPLHDSLLTLEPEIVVTTNYDKIFERASNNGYYVHTHTSTTVGRDIRSGNPVVLKIHGSVDDGSRVVLTRSDYARLRREGAHSLEVLQALFLTRTALFVGYGLGDPDIQLLLENAVGARGETASHYVLASKKVPEFERVMLEYCFGTTLVTFADGDFGEMARMLSLLGDEVTVRRNAAP